jgi:hypothetical protein
VRNWTVAGRRLERPVPNPQFVDMVRDVVGLSLNALARALVVCVDENTQIQARNHIPLAFPVSNHWNTVIADVDVHPSSGYVRFATMALARPMPASLMVFPAVSSGVRNSATAS